MLVHDESFYKQFEISRTAKPTVRRMDGDLVDILVEDGVEECLDSGLVFESGRVLGKGG